MHADFLLMVEALKMLHAECYLIRLECDNDFRLLLGNAVSSIMKHLVLCIADKTCVFRKAYKIVMTLSG